MPGLPKVETRELVGIAESGTFTGRMIFLSPNQQCQSTEWIIIPKNPEAFSKQLQI